MTVLKVYADLVNMSLLTQLGLIYERVEINGFNIILLIEMVWDDQRFFLYNFFISIYLMITLFAS